MLLLFTIALLRLYHVCFACAFAVRFCGYGENRQGCRVFLGVGVDPTTNTPWFGSFSSTSNSRAAGGVWSSITAPTSSAPLTLHSIASVPAGVYRLPLTHNLDGYLLRVDTPQSNAILGYPFKFSGKLQLRAANFHYSGVRPRAGVSAICWVLIM